MFCVATHITLEVESAFACASVAVGRFPCAEFIYTTCPSVIVDPVLFTTLIYCSVPSERVTPFVVSRFIETVPSVESQYICPFVADTLGEVLSCIAFTLPRVPVSLSVIVPFCTSFPVVVSNRTRALSVEEAGQIISPVPDSVKSPLHSRVFQFIVLMFVPDTSESCFPEFRFEKFVFTSSNVELIVSVDSRVYIDAIVFS